jgi:hypothetical protein
MRYLDLKLLPSESESQLGFKCFDWLKRNKRWFGFAFFLASGYIVTFKCPGLEPYCAKLLLILTNVGSLLTGAGLIDSDKREGFVQGVIPKP